MGPERSRSAGVGAVHAHQPAGDGPRTRLVAAGDGKPPGLLDRGTGAALRPQPELGGQPAGAGGDLAATGATTGARRPTRTGHRHALSGAGGARQHRALPTAGGSLRSRYSTLDDAASRGTISRVAPSEPRTARTHRGGAGVIPQGATAGQFTGKAVTPNRRPGPTCAGRTDLATASDGERATSARPRHRTVARTPTKNRGARTSC